MLKSIKKNCKKTLSALIFFLLPSCIFGFSFGIKNETALVKNTKNRFPDFFEDITTRIFISKTYIYNNYFFTLSPALVFKNDIAFKFNELKTTMAFEKVVFSLGKYNSYWGSGFYHNPFFSNIPINNAYKENVWNAKLSYIVKNWEFNCGLFLDTDSIDKFKRPEWQNYYCYMQYSNQDFFAGVESDYLHNTNNRVIKFAAEVLLSKFNNISIYTSGGGKYDFTNKHFAPFSFLLGFSHYLNFEKGHITYIIDGGIKENKPFTSMKFISSFFETCGFETQADYFNNELYLSTSIKFDIASASFSLQYISPDLIDYKKRGDKLIISMSLEGSI